MPEIRGVPVVTISALQERGFDKMMDAVFATVEKWNARISTGQLNRWFEAGRRAKSAARSLRTADQDQICHAGAKPAADLRACSAINSIICRRATSAIS